MKTLSEGLGRSILEMVDGFSRIKTAQSRHDGIDLLAMDASSTLVLKHSDITEKVIRIFYEVYNELGHGFLESTYAAAMAIGLEQAGLSAQREVPVPVWFRGIKVGQYYADIVVEEVVLLELKGTRTVEPFHEAQLLHYLRATQVEVGLLLNFGLQPKFRRMLFDNERKKMRESPCESSAQVPA